MSKCENCYHARACLNSLSENKGLNNAESFVCEHYKDKSLIVELPCNVSDIVYEVDGEIYELKIKKVIVSKSNMEFECFDIDSIDDAEFNLNDIGKTVFLSHEEAERALEEREKNG